MEQPKICRTCKEEFEEWGDLANHINTSRDARHKKDKAGKKWAANFKYKNVLYKNKPDDFYRAPITQEQREAKQDSRRVLSNKMLPVKVICPNPKCKRTRIEMLEKEYVESPNAVKVDNCYQVLCGGCR